MVTSVREDASSAFNVRLDYTYKDGKQYVRAIGRLWYAKYDEESDFYTDWVPKEQGYAYKAEIKEETVYNTHGYRYTLKLLRRQLNLPSIPSSIKVPSTIKGGEKITISWGSSSGASRYHLERSVNGGSWTQIYSGNSLSYIDSITKGWNTVTYRVRAYNSDGYSDYRASPTRNVINNSSPTITVTSPSENSFLARKSL